MTTSTPTSPDKLVGVYMGEETLNWLREHLPVGLSLSQRPVGSNTVTVLPSTAYLRAKACPVPSTCMSCLPRPGEDEYGDTLLNGFMRLCPKCGNKRCPYISDHTIACTGSNEPGQIGSIFR